MPILPAKLPHKEQNHHQFHPDTLKDHRMCLMVCCDEVNWVEVAALEENNNNKKKGFNGISQVFKAYTGAG